MTDQSLPAPLTPADADLQDFAFMPLHVSRLRDSDLAAEEEPEACWYALLLWAASWHQLPAGSLPDNDTVLIRLAGLGRDRATWQQHRDGALRGFVKCSDGRLYHPVVAELVANAWDSKLRQRHRTFCATIRKHNERNPENKIDAPSFEDWMAGGCPGTVSDLVTQPRRTMSQPVTRDTASKGEGQGDREGEGESNKIEEEREREVQLPKVKNPAAAAEAPAEPGTGISADLQRIVDAAGIPNMDPGHYWTRWNAGIGRLKGWYEKGYELERDILPAIERTLRKLPSDETIGSLAKIERELFGQRAKAAAYTQPVAVPATPIDFGKPSETVAMTNWRMAAAAAMGGVAYRNLLDGAALAVGDGELSITIGSAVTEMQLRNDYLYRIEPLAGRFLNCRLVRLVVDAQQKAA